MIDFQLNEDFLEEVEKFTEKKLSQRSILSELIKTINENNKIEKFNELIFTAKYVNGLYRAIKVSQDNPQISNLEQIKKDFIYNLEKVLSLINEIFNKNNPEEIKEYAHQSNTIGEIKSENLLQLIEDLDQIKKYINYLKRKN